MSRTDSQPTLSRPEDPQHFAQLVVNALQTQIAIIDESGLIVAVNDAWRSFVSTHKTCVANMTEGDNYLGVLDHIAATGTHAAARMVEGVRDVIADKLPQFELEYPCGEEDGTPRWFSAKVTRFIHRGEVRIVIAHDNITSRKNIEQTLSESNRQFRAWAETSSDMICRHAPDGTFIYISPACRSILGYEPQELMGKFPYNYFHPDDVARIRQSHERVLATDRAEAIAYRFRRRDGVYRWVESTSLAVKDAAGNVVEIHTATRDVEQRRRQEEALRRIQSAIEQVQDAVLITTPQLNKPGPQIVYVNPAFSQLTGYRAEEVIGKTPRVLQGPKTDRAVLDRLRKTLSDGEVFRGTTVNYRKDGSEFLNEWQVAPVRDEQGRITHFVSIQRDITEKVRQQERARQREAELAHVARMSTMGEMASGLAHELNQPLSAVVNFTQGCLRRMQRGDWSPGPLIGAMQQASDQASRAAEIIRRLRQFIHKRGPKVAPTRLHELIEDAAALMGHDLTREQVKLVVDRNDEVPMVHVDAIQIEQVILNLMRNAVDAMKANTSGKRQLTVRKRRCGNDEVTIDVIDTGPIVSPDTMSHLFEPFYTTKSEGMGLGLSISQSIIESHGGRLTATANPTGGMTFTITLPLGNHHVAAKSEASTTAP